MRDADADADATRLTVAPHRVNSDTHAMAEVGLSILLRNIFHDIRYVCEIECRILQCRLVILGWTVANRDTFRIVMFNTVNLLVFRRRSSSLNGMIYSLIERNV